MFSHLLTGTGLCRQAAVCPLVGYASWKPAHTTPCRTRKIRAGFCPTMQILPGNPHGQLVESIVVKAAGNQDI
jgi:hypothetical protein